MCVFVLELILYYYASEKPLRMSQINSLYNLTFVFWQRS